MVNLRGKIIKLAEETPYLRKHLVPLLKVTSIQKNSFVLDKKWLMGVKRGWKQTINKSVGDYSDALKIVMKLQVFNENLREQVTLVRRAWPAEVANQGKKMLDAFDKMDTLLHRAKKAVVYWTPNPKEDVSEGSKITLYNYKKDLDGTLGGSVKKPHSYGLTKPVPLTYHFDRLMRVLYSASKEIKEYHDANPTKSLLTFEDEAYRFFSIKNMKVVIVAPQEHRDIRAYVKRVGAAYQLLKKHGFEKSWYGNLYVMSDNPKILTIEEKILYKIRGVNVDSFAGTYGWKGDQICLYAPGWAKITTLTLLHELGHRYWFKRLRKADRDRFSDWFDNGLAPVSVYGGSNASEAFAEVFSYYCMGANISRDQIESFKQIVKKGFGKDYPRALDFHTRHTESEIKMLKNLRLRC